MTNSTCIRAALIVVAGMMTLSFVAPKAIASDTTTASSTQGVASLPDSLRYIQYTPSMCVPHQQQWRSTRAFRADTIPWGPFVAAWHPDAIAEARRCVSRFSIANVEPRELLGFGEALLAAGNMQSADSAFERLAHELALQSPAVRAWGMNRIVAANLRARPARLVIVDSYLTKLREMGDSALGMLALAHLEIAHVAQQADSTRLMEEHTQAAFDALQKLSPDSAKRYARLVLEAYKARAIVEARRGEFEKARTTIKEVENIIRRIRPALSLNVMDIAKSFTLLGTPAAPIAVHRWKNISGERSAPIDGKINMLVFVRAECGDQCFEGYSVIRRMAQRYPDLEITLILNTGGYYRSMLVSVEKEAELVTEFFNTVLQISLPMAFWESQFDRRDVDGRLLIREVPNNESYHQRELARALYPGPIAFLVDQDGMIRRNMALSWKTAAMVENMIGKMTAE